MNIKKINLRSLLAIFTIGLAITACQKMERPEFGEIILDPPPPPYSVLKNYFAFEDNAGDSGQFRMATKAENVTFVEGINGKAAQIGEGGYIVQQSVNDSIKTPGSFSLSFWMNGVGPVTGGAQGLFSISNSAEFWGNLDLFLENHEAGGADEAFLKVHMFNYTHADKGEEWNEIKIPAALNKWTHIAVTYNAANSQFSIFADGVPTAIHNKVLKGGAYGPMTFKDVNGMVIGTYQFQTDPPLSGGKQDWARSFNGALDQFRFYNVALSDAEVGELFSGKQ